MMKILIFVLLFFNNIKAEEIYYVFDYTDSASDQSYEYNENSYTEDEDNNYQDNLNEYMAHDERILIHQQEFESPTEPM